MNHRIEFNNIINELKEQMKSAPVKIISGPCVGIVVNDAESLHEYACQLDEWMFPRDHM